MGYPPRVYFDGAMYHITSRGNNRQSIFADDADRQEFLMFLRRYKDRFRFKLFAYVLMPNHTHLVLAPSSGTTVSQIMQCHFIAYAKYFNRRHGRVGHVFQGRFHSRLIETDTHLLVVTRYVHLNPVQATLVPHPATFVWSSYRAYQVPQFDPLRLIDVEDVVGGVSPGGRMSRQDYCAFVESAKVSDMAHI